MILRQAAGIIKKAGPWSGSWSRAFSGDTFAMLLNQTTLHDALPMAERVRKALGDARFSHGIRPLRVTASIGVAQLRADEMRGAEPDRVSQALAAAKQAGGNVCFRHDGENVSSGVVGVSSQNRSEMRKSRYRWPRCGAIRATWAAESQQDAEHYAAQLEIDARCSRSRGNTLGPIVVRGQFEPPH